MIRLLFILIPFIAFGQVVSNQVGHYIGTTPSGTALGSTQFAFKKRGSDYVAPTPSIPEITLSTKYAFPGAFGAGKDITGGRGGSFYEVTNLNATGANSFHTAISSGSRNIIIKVEGFVDRGTTTTTVTGSDDYTIYGQFAPGRGLTIGGTALRIKDSQNHIIRFMTFQNEDGGSGDSFNRANEEGVYTPPTEDGIYLDHCSFRYGHDEILDIETRGDGTDDEKITVAYNIIAESAGTGSRVGQTGVGDAGQITWARNMYYNVPYRTPNPAATDDGSNDIHIDVFNNFITNYKTRLSRTTGDVFIDWHYNYVEAGNVPKASATPLNKMGSPSADMDTYTGFNYVESWDETPSDNQTNLWVNYKAQDGNPDNDPISSYHYVSKINSFGNPDDGIWAALDVKTKVMASAGHNRGINADGSPGFFRDDKDATYVTKATAGTTESTYRASSAWDNSTFTSTADYGDDDGDYMPDWFEQQGFDQPSGGETALDFESAADRDQVIVAWDFGDYTVVNTAGYTNFEMCAAFYAGDFETILDGTNDLDITP